MNARRSEAEGSGIIVEIPVVLVQLLPVAFVDTRCDDAVYLDRSGPDITVVFKSKYSGIWEGWMCRKKACDIKVAIEILTSKGGKGVVAIADESSGKWMWRVTFVFLDGELVAHLPNNDTVALLMRSDGNLDIKKSKTDGSWNVGILGRLE